MQHYSSHGSSPTRGGTATSDTEIKCKFTGKIEVDRQGDVLNGYFSCPKVYTPPVTPSEYALLYRAIQGEAINTVITKKCLYRTVRFAIEIHPTKKHGAELTIRALEIVAPTDTIKAPPPDKASSGKMFRKQQSFTVRLPEEASGSQQIRNIKPSQNDFGDDGSSSSN